MGFDDLKKKAKKNRLPELPGTDVTKGNLDQPEVAPSDGRSAKAKGKSVQFNTKVTPTFKKEFQEFLLENNINFVAEGLELLLSSYNQRKEVSPKAALKVIRTAVEFFEKNKAVENG